MKKNLFLITAAIKQGQDKTCAMCDREAICEYDGEPSCGRAKCEIQIQVAKDYHEERG